MQENDSDRSTTPPGRFSKHARVRITIESWEGRSGSVKPHGRVGRAPSDGHIAVVRWCRGAVVSVKVPTVSRFGHVMM